MMTNEMINLEDVVDLREELEKIKKEETCNVIQCTFNFGGKCRANEYFKRKCIEGLRRARNEKPSDS
jgi:methenyltetrahydromethanopterin cyclohydrolase